MSSLRFAAVSTLALGMSGLPGCTLDIEGQAGEGGSASSTTSTTGTSGGESPTSSSSGIPPNCGNKVVDPGESCDGVALGGETCESQGFVAGVLRCSSVCELDTSDCIAAGCGNGLVDGAEDCDGAELASATCASRGFAGGTLACTAACAFDESACKPDFTADFETGMPPEFTFSGNADWSVVANPNTSATNAFVARSGAIAGNQASGMLITLQFDAAGTIRFLRRTSSETNDDYLRFFIDGAQRDAWSGTSATTFDEQSYAVTAGTHSFEWRYTKDALGVSGSDQVWVDDIVAEGGYLP